MKISEVIKELEKQLNGYMSEIGIKGIEHCPFIVEVGALTVGTDNVGAVTLQNKNYPMQFSEESVKKIKSMEFKNNSNKPVIPRVYTKNEWYRQQIDRIKETIDGLRKLEDKE